MEKRMAETRMALEVHVGKHFAELPDGAQAVLFMETLKTLVGETLPVVVGKIKAPGTEFPFKIKVNVELADGNTVEGQNIMDDLNIDQEMRPK